jgi:hypothetical protein
VSRLRYLEELAADTIIGLSLSQVERNAAVCARFLTKFSMSMGARNENVSASFPAHIGHQWARRKDDEIIHRYTDTVVGSAQKKTPAMAGVKHCRVKQLRQAEGTGLEPATPCGAPHFQCGR